MHFSQVLYVDNFVTGVYYVSEMSLFKARDWWSTVVEGEDGREEECDAGCLAIANINNEKPAKEKIIVGGFSGNLRVFFPQVRYFNINLQKEPGSLNFYSNLSSEVLSLESSI